MGSQFNSFVVKVSSLIQVSAKLYMFVVGILELMPWTLCTSVCCCCVLLSVVVVCTCV